MNIDVMKQALEALELNNAEWRSLADSGDTGYWRAEDQSHYTQTSEAITALRTAIEEAEKQSAERGEPVAQAEQLSKELLGVIADVEEGDGFDDVCLDTIKYVYEQLATPPAAPVQERNFCERCGKRLGDGHIHTCTPPEAPVQEPPDDELTQALIQRDEAENTADELAQAIAQITGEDIGEHTSANFPWRNALDAAENWLCHPPAAQRQWVGLTDEELAEFSNAKLGAYDLCLEVEAKLKEKNT